jgi:ubiquitin-like modifier-activating enzyme ATG7
MISTLNSQNAEGKNMSIPMPGHPVSKSEVANVQNAVNTLSDLIDKHDVVFILMDSRESRWLPTLLCAAAKKVNSAPEYFTHHSSNSW